MMTRFAACARLLGALAVAFALPVCAAPERGALSADRVRVAVHPHGIAQWENDRTGRLEPPVFSLLAIAAVPGTTRSVVVYSEHSGGNAARQVAPRARRTIETAGDSARLIGAHDVTKQMPVFIDEVGMFVSAQARVNIVRFREQILADVIVWSAISGTGGFNESTDLFYRVDGDGQLRPIGTIGSTSLSGRSGDRLEQEVRSELLFDPLREQPEVVVQRIQIKRTRSDSDDAPKIECVGSGAVTMRLSDGNAEVVKILSPAELETRRAALIALPRFSFAPFQPCSESHRPSKIRR